MRFQKDKIYHLSGAIGTEILRRGFPTKLPLWSAQVLFDRPELLRQIYLDYIRAGADIITTNTFRTQGYTLKKVGLENETKRINRLAVKIAADARTEAGAERPIYIAGCITTLEDCYRPDLIPPEDVLKKEHTQQCAILGEMPIDFFLLETFNSIKEAIIAMEAAVKTGKRAAISFTARSDGNILNGDNWEEAAARLKKYSPLAILVNCVPPAVATRALCLLAPSAGNIPFGVYANGAGAAGSDDGWDFSASGDPIDSYFKACQEWQSLGATIIGGCCGTNPEYTKRCSEIN